MCLTKGDTQSCGCLNRERWIALSTTHGQRNTLSYRLWCGAKGRAKLFGLPFDIEFSDIVIPDFCPLLDIPLIPAKRAISNNSPTVDRIVPVKGYVKGNVWVISQKANQMKSDNTVEQMRHFIKVIEAKLGEVAHNKATDKPA